MKISLYTPDLTAEEAERYWMTPVEVCRLAAIGEASDPKVKKLLNTLSDRGHVPFVKSGTAKTAPRLYSLVSAAMLRVIHDITRDGRTYKYAQPVANSVRAAILKCASEMPDLIELDTSYADARIIFADINDNGEPRTVKWQYNGQISSGRLTYSVYEAGYMIFRIIQIYADFWHDDLVKRGEIEPAAPRAVGSDGWPVREGE